MASKRCVAGKHSGRNALRTKLHSLGLDLNQDQLDDVFKRFKVKCTPSSKLSALWRDLLLSLSTGSSLATPLQLRSAGRLVQIESSMLSSRSYMSE